MSRKPKLRDERDVVAWAIWDEMRGRAGIKHFFLHVEGKPTEGAFSDHRKWLREVAATVLKDLATAERSEVTATGVSDKEPGTRPPSITNYGADL